MKIATKAAVASGLATMPAAVCSRLRTPGGACTSSTGRGAVLRPSPCEGKSAGRGFSALDDDMSAMSEFSLPSSGLLAAKSRTPSTLCDIVAW